MSNYFRLLSLTLLAAFVACGDDGSSEDPTIIPTNLEVTITNSDNGSGLVSVTATADNAFAYDFFFGEFTNDPIRSSSGIVNYTYSESGEYDIEVRALGNGADYASYSETIDVFREGIGGTVWIPPTGYTTPTSYSGWTMIWQDEFSGTSLNTSDWNYEIGGHGWGNNELQYYQQDNTSMVQGHLVIEAREQNVGGRAYTSSRLTTQNKFDFQYGRVDIRAALPKGQGIWPALWMLGSDFSSVGWPFCGEIDIMEMIGGGEGRDDTVHGTCHWEQDGHANFGGSRQLSSGDFYDEFHVFSITWTSSEIRWYLDDVQYHVISTTPSEMDEFRDSFFFIFNVAVGGNWPGSPNGSTQFPQRMVVDYIRVFQPD